MIEWNLIIIAVDVFMTTARQLVLFSCPPELYFFLACIRAWMQKEPVCLKTLICGFKSCLNLTVLNVQTDLVAWVTIGATHMPSSEDIPITTTPLTRVSFFIRPHKYVNYLCPIPRCSNPYCLPPPCQDLHGTHAAVPHGLHSSGLVLVLKDTLA